MGIADPDCFVAVWYVAALIRSRPSGRVAEKAWYESEEPCAESQRLCALYARLSTAARTNGLATHPCSIRGLAPLLLARSRRPRAQCAPKPKAGYQGALPLNAVASHGVCPRSLGQLWASGLAVTNFPDPEQPEALAVPADDGFRLDDDQGRSPIPPNVAQPSPEDSIGGRQFRPLHRATQDAKFVPERDVL
jgi:hypothetical protein